MSELAWHQRLVGATPRWVHRMILRFEAIIDDRLEEFARGLGADDRVLDAGAGELQYAHRFRGSRYFSIDLGVGDSGWDYGGLDVVGDLARLPFHDRSFDAAVNVVVLEHTREPQRVLLELERVLRPEGRLLIVVPQEWGMHQRPHDYFRFTRHGIEMLLERAGFRDLRCEPVGGFFTLLGRRILDSTLFFQGGWRWLLLPFVALLAAPVGLLLPYLDGLDPGRETTLGYVCEARKGAA